MHSENKRVVRERSTMTRMIGINCSAHHDSFGDVLCAACREFQDYTEVRLQKCPYGEDKPTCANCPVHCYKPARRAQAREIMRYAGPRWTKYIHELSPGRIYCKTRPWLGIRRVDH